MTRTRVVGWGLLVLSVVGAGGHLVVTAETMGISPDSVDYLGSARALMAGRGLVVACGPDRGKLLTHWPPLYPAVLSVLGRVADMMSAARWLAAGLFAACIFLGGWTVFAGSRSAVLSLFAAFTLFASADLLHVSMHVWSEPLFLACLLTGFLLLDRYLRGAGRPWLLAGAVMMALAFLTRYAGVFAVATALLAILLFDRRTWRARVGSVLLFGAVSCLPMSLWFVRNVLGAASLTGRSFLWHPITLERAAFGLRTVAHWVVPAGPLPEAVLALVGAVTLTTVSLLAGVLFFRTRRPEAPDEEGGDASLPLVLVLFALTYVAGFVATICWFDAATQPNWRVMIPVHVALLAAVPCLVRRALLLWTPRSRVVKILAVLLCATFAVRYAVGAARWSVARARDGSGYTTRAWRHSETVAFLRSVPGDVPLYSNAYDGLYFLLGHEASFRLPVKTNPQTLLTNEASREQLDAVKRHLERDRGYLVYFTTLVMREYTLTEEELTRRLPLRRVFSGTDGSVYVVVSPGGAAAE